MKGTLKRPTIGTTKWKRGTDLGCCENIAEMSFRGEDVLLNGFISQQAVPHHGVSSEPITEGSEGILGLVTRWASALGSWTIGERLAKT